MKIGVLCNCEKDQASQVLDRLAKKAAELNVELIAWEETAELLPSAGRVPRSKLADHIEVLIALGGDGTMLNAVHILGGADIPLLGVNLGSLGFMTSVSEKQLEIGLEAIASKSYTTSSRDVAVCKLTELDGKRQTFRALNDVVIGWGDSSRIATLNVSVDGEHVTSYKCDGLIVSTPTGSTGHSLSAGGPVVHPAISAFLLNVICAHTLSARPMLIPNTSTIVVDIEDAPKNMILSIDGQEDQQIKKGDRLEINGSPQKVRFIHLPGYSYYSLLRQKLHWRGSSI